MLLDNELSRTLTDKDTVAPSYARELNFWRLIFKFIYVPINMYFLIKIIFRIVELGGWQL